MRAPSAFSMTLAACWLERGEREEGRGGSGREGAGERSESKKESEEEEEEVKIEEEVGQTKENQSISQLLLLLSNPLLCLP